MNFYLINEAFHFVDVPGYGYAKVSKSERAAWGEMIETYFTSREQLKAVILIVDFRHEPTEDDVMMYDFLKHYEIPCIVIATKADKIPKGKWQKHLKITKEKLNLDQNDQIVIFSSETEKEKKRLGRLLKVICK